MRVSNVLENALQGNRISRQEWELVLDHATVENDAITAGENGSLNPLATLLAGGEVMVEGMSQAEILRRLAVFA